MGEDGLIAFRHALMGPLSSVQIQPLLMAVAMVLQEACQHACRLA
jgi:hypothetical protein